MIYDSMNDNTLNKWKVNEWNDESEMKGNRD